MTIALNAIGLILNMSGTLLWFFFGLATFVDTSGRMMLAADGEIDQKEAAKARRFKRISQTGLGMLFVGFLAQFLALFF